MECSVSISNNISSNINNNTLELGELWLKKIDIFNKVNNTDFKLRLVKNKARGNCLFIAFEQAFPNLNRVSLRRQTVDYILNDWTLLHRLLLQNINDYNNDMREDTYLLNGIGWPEGGPITILELLETENPKLHEKAKKKLRPILLRATYYADNEMIEALENVLNIGIILLSNSSGEIAWHAVSKNFNKYVVIYNYDDCHYELVQISNVQGKIFQNNWEGYENVPIIIKKLLPEKLVIDKTSLLDDKENLIYRPNLALFDNI